MAFTSDGSLGSSQEKVSDTSIALAVTANAEVGRVVGVWVVMDNEGTARADTTQLSVTDDSGNEYVRVRERTESSGAANDGVVLGLFVSVIKTQLNSGSNITVTSTSARTAKSMSAWKWSMGSTGVAIQATAVQNATNADPQAISLSGMTSREYLLLWAFGCEDVVPISTHDADYSPIDDIGTSGSTADTNVTIDGAYRIATLTGDTVDAATATTTQHAQILAAIYEVTVQDRVTQMPVEAVVVPSTAQARMTQAPVEAIVVPTTAQARLTALAVEVVVIPTAPVSGAQQVMII